MKATKLVLAGIALAIAAILVAGTIHHSSKNRLKTSSVHVRNSNDMSPTRTGLMTNPLSTLVKLPY